MEGSPFHPSVRIRYWQVPPQHRVADDPAADRSGTGAAGLYAPALGAAALDADGGEGVDSSRFG